MFFFKGKYQLFFLLFVLTVNYTVNARRYIFDKNKLGGNFQIIVYSNLNEEEVNNIVNKSYSLVDSLNVILSNYNASSQVSVLNSTKMLANPSAHLLHVLNASKNAYKLTNGYFDISIKPALALWESAASKGVLPNKNQLHAMRKNIGFSKVVKFKKNGAIVLKRNGALELGGIAKGYIIDEVYNYLKAQKLTSFLVEAAGDIRVFGAPEGKEHWVVGVSSNNKSQKTVQLNSGQAIATSGKTYRFHTIDGVHYSHIVNPKNLMPITHSNTSSVIAANATTADYLASTFNILTNTTEINSVLKKHPTTELLLFHSKGIVFATPLFLTKKTINNEK